MTREYVKHSPFGEGDFVLSDVRFFFVWGGGMGDQGGQRDGVTGDRLQST